jgi:hypothetical protein
MLGRIIGIEDSSKAVEEKILLILPIRVGVEDAGRTLGEQGKGIRAEKGDEGFQVLAQTVHENEGRPMVSLGPIPLDIPIVFEKHASDPRLPLEV